MLAAYYESNGPADEVLKVAEVPTPMPAAGEVRVRLKTSGVNPSDVKSRVGVIGKIPFPRVIPHSDGAGVIDQVGEGVDTGRLGQRVWIWNAQWMRPFGSAAQYVTLPEVQAVPLPAHIDDDAAACLGIPALTAQHAVSLAGPLAGKTVLVAGGAGAVAHYAIQIAKAAGAKVLTTISSPEKAQLVSAAGADVAINYRSENVGAIVKEHTGGRGVDVVIELDLAANARLLPELLATKGKVVAYGTSAAELSLPAFFCLLNSIRIEFFLIYTLNERDRAAAVAGLSDLLERNALIHNVATRLPLSQVIAAHELVESGKAIGNVVLLIEQDGMP
jgi:NADPH2:quinone reductase